MLQMDWRQHSRLGGTRNEYGVKRRFALLVSEPAPLDTPNTEVSLKRICLLANRKVLIGGAADHRSPRSGENR
jgi:hypothetical protein